MEASDTFLPLSGCPPFCLQTVCRSCVRDTPLSSPTQREVISGFVSAAVAEQPQPRTCQQMSGPLD
eukprot:6340040-Amphidinium_carterae.1